MNAQRWLALGLVALLVICIGTSNVWLPSLLEDEDAGTPTPTPELANDDTDSEASATAAAGGMADSQPTLDPVIAELLAEAQMEALGVGDEPFIVIAGDFTVIDALHRGEGTASIYRLGEASHVLRLDPFSVTTGPDLRVILSFHPMPRTSADALLPTYVDLGLLKNTSGAQNYDIPEGLKLEDYHSVVIFSMSLKIVFTSAEIEPVRGGSR